MKEQVHKKAVFIDNYNAKNNKDIIRLENNNPVEQISITSESKENPQEKDINVDLDIETNESRKRQRVRVFGRRRHGYG